MGNGSLSSDQLSQLNELKRALEAQPSSSGGDGRQADDAIGRPSLIPLTQVRDPLINRLWDRLATPSEGIEFFIEGAWWPAPVGVVDRQLFDLAVNRGAHGKRMALGFPRVPVGISTWLAVATMVAHVATAETALVQTRPWLVVASRERRTREIFLSERLTFSGVNLSIGQFPSFRLRRNASLAPISVAHPSRFSMPVLFYHLEPLPEGAIDLPRGNVALVLAEITESDSRLTPVLLERLQALSKGLGEPSELVFFNSFDDSARGGLIARGYAVSHLRPPPVVLPPGVPMNIPTVLASSQGFRLRQTVKFSVVADDAGVSEKLFHAAKLITRTGGLLDGGPGKRVLAGWWSLWRTMKDLAVPLAKYERAKIARGSGSLELAIARAVRRANFVEGSDGGRLQSAARDVGPALNGIYDLLGKRVPKAELLSELLDPTITSSDTLLAVADRAQVDQLNEEFLMSGRESGDSPLIGTHINIANLARGGPVTRLLLTGAWAPWHDSPIIACGSSEVHVLIYPYEAQTLLRRLDEHYAEASQLFDRIGRLERLPAILELVGSDREALERASKGRWIMETTLPGRKKRKAEPVQEEYFEEDDLTEDDERPRGALTFELSDGSKRRFAPESEVLRLTQDGVESVFASLISEGDDIAILREGSARSIFQVILGRVNHLVGADQQVIDIWRATLQKVADMYPISNGTMTLKLRQLGCTRVEQTIRNWFSGSTMAPSDVEDIRRILELSQFARPQVVARLINKEVEVVRTFNRRLGARIHEQIRIAATGGAVTARDRLEFELDEAIEALEYVTVISVGHEAD